MSQSLDERLASPGPKRLLALDGGGVRGLVSLGFLHRIESLLRRRYDRDDFVLSDYFDLIGGTSTGAIIAGLLAMGRTVDEIREQYMDLGAAAFRLKRYFLGPVGRLLGAKFEEKQLERFVREYVKDRTLDDPDIRTALLLILKRADTASVWAITNAPKNHFYEMNRKMRLWKLIMASTAAPTFFRPQLIRDVGDGNEGVFIDGGVSMHTNPALQLLMAANLQGFGLRWPLGPENILLCSVGTGSFESTATPTLLQKFTNLNWAGLLLRQLMRDATELNETLLQWLSDSPTARSIDMQIGSLEDDHLSPEPRLTYLRYDLMLEKKELDALGFDYSEDAVKRLRDLSDTRNLNALASIGEKAAAAQIDEEHFPEGFDRRP